MDYNSYNYIGFDFIGFNPFVAEIINPNRINFNSGLNFNNPETILKCLEKVADQAERETPLD